MAKIYMQFQYSTSWSAISTPRWAQIVSATGFLINWRLDGHAPIPVFCHNHPVRAEQLQIVPEKLELTGRDPVHGVIVSLTADDGKLSDATRRVTYSIAQSQTAAVDSQGMVTALADG